MKRSELFLLLVLFAVLAGWWYAARREHRKARATVVAYYFPENYSGWITVKFNVKKSKPLPFTRKGDGGIYKVEVPKDGVVLTSSPFYTEKHITRYYRLGKTGVTLLQEGGFGVKTDAVPLGGTWISGGSYSDSFLQFYVFKKPVPSSTPPPPPSGKHLKVLKDE